MKGVSSIWINFPTTKYEYSRVTRSFFAKQDHVTQSRGRRWGSSMGYDFCLEVCLKLGNCALVVGTGTVDVPGSRAEVGLAIFPEELETKF